MDKQRMKKEGKQRQTEQEKKKVFRISKKHRPPEDITEQTENSANLSTQEKFAKAKKLAASFGKAKTVVSSSKSDSNKSSAVSDKSSSKHKHNKPSHSEQRKTGNDKHSNNKDVPKQSDKKSSYKDKLEKMSDREKLAIIKKISRYDQISDTEKLDKIRKISETIRKGSSSNSVMNEKQNGYPTYSPLSSKIDRYKMTGNLESLQKIKKEFKEDEVNGKTITILGKTDEGIKREVIFDRTDAETMRYALQEKAERITAKMNRPEEPKLRERKKGNHRESETEAKRKKSETSKHKDDEKRKDSDFKKSSSHSSVTKYNDKYSDDRYSDRSSSEEKPVKKKKPSPHTSMNLNHVNDLLKIAEQKYQETVKIEVHVVKKPKKQEERLLTKREMAFQREHQEYSKKKKKRREAEIEERQTVDAKRKKQISNLFKSKSTSNLVAKSASFSQTTVRKNSYSEKIVTKSLSPVPCSFKPSTSIKLGKSMSSSSILSKPFTKQVNLHSATHSQHNSDSNPAKKRKREHTENETISKEHRKKSNSAKRSNSKDARENVLVCEPPKNEKPVFSNPPERMYGKIKKIQPTKPEMNEQRTKEERKQRQIEEEKKEVFRIPKKPHPPEEITEQTDKSAKLSTQEKLEKAKKLAASFGKAKTAVSSSKSDSNKSSAVSDKSSSNHKHVKPSYLDQRKTGNDKHSYIKDVPNQSDKKPLNNKHSNNKDVPKQSDKKPLNNKHINNKDVPKKSDNKPSREKHSNNKDVPEQSDKKSSNDKHINNKDVPKKSDKKPSREKHSNNKDVPKQSDKKSSNDKHINNKYVHKQSDKKLSYKDKLEKMSDQEKLAIIKKISRSLGRVGDKISDTEKLDKIGKISETIGKGSSSKSDINEKPNGSQKHSPLSSKIERDKMTGNLESLPKIKQKFKEAEERVNGKAITMLGKTDKGIKREVIFDRTDAETMRYALQEKAARISDMMKKPEEPKHRKRKKAKDRASETEPKGKQSQTSKNEDDKQRKYSDFKECSSHSSAPKYNDKYSDDRHSDRSLREKKPVKKKKPPPPPSINFYHVNGLSKIDEQKSQEPVKVEVIKKPKKEKKRLSKREIASQREYQDYFKNKKIRRETEIEERKTVDVKRETQISNSLKRKSTSSLVAKSASFSQKTVRKNRYSEKLVTKSSSPVPCSSKPSTSIKLGKSMSSSSILSKPFTKQVNLHSATHSQHNSDSNPAKKRKREHTENETISKEHRKKSNSAKRSNSKDARENVLVCVPPKNRKPVSSNPPERIYGEIKKNQPTKPDQIRQAVIVRTDNMATSHKRSAKDTKRAKDARGAKDTRGTVKGIKRSKGTDHYSKDVSLKSVRPTQPTSEIVLRIIAKTNMNNGYCYLGFDEVNGRLFRPIFDTSVCCWPLWRDFCWTKSYRFKVTVNPDEKKIAFSTPYPHCNDDMVVTSFVKEEKTEPFKVHVLINIAKLSINEIFFDIKETKYLVKNARSPSAGILKCRSKNVCLYYDNHSKSYRFKIYLPSGDYDLPITAINHDEIPEVDREVLVVLGLGRPYHKERSYNPSRCYILVVGLFVL